MDDVKHLGKTKMAYETSNKRSINGSCMRTLQETNCESNASSFRKVNERVFI